MRELIISRGRTGYVALYSLEEDQDAVLILAICHQREAGYLGQDGDWLLCSLVIQIAEKLYRPERDSDRLKESMQNRGRQLEPLK
ncbi:hypothetical protein SAMN05216420_102306 [Nitrosospira sp. Nl5]|uniref:hypothetical protein n=1 Tax=Nitrosospira sp. Nl5 TaxID=200120 RepID=UPI00088AE2D1|nr:hypothetical protein [Nitrosospira sp. Nl5]SCY10251.1 hypothetical protein SAMN05216420_102306 [Nitrosospira sp. Nl5]